MSTHPERRHTDRLERFAAHHPFAVDLTLVLALMVCAVLGGQISLPGAEPPSGQATHPILIAVCSLVLLGHRRHPGVAVWVTAGCTILAGIDGYLVTPLLLAPMMGALYWLAADTDRRTTCRYGLTAIAAVAVGNVFAGAPHGISVLLPTIGPLFWLLLPLAAGVMTRMRRAYLAAVQARAEHAERTREEEARLRVTEERMRIARELHDVVAHHLALANAQAGTAAHLVLDQPEQTRRILTDLTGTTSSALRELKATLGLLRRSDDPGSAPLEPSPGLDRLPELIASCASAGLRVTVTTEGEARPLSPGVDLTAYRIVQEALTNITKHAGTDRAHLLLTYTSVRLIITVSDDGVAAPAGAPAGPGKGFGLMGMWERANSVGGDLRAGPRPDGGFEVTTALPLHSLAPDPAEQPPDGDGDGDRERDTDAEGEEEGDRDGGMRTGWCLGEGRRPAGRPGDDCPEPDDRDPGVAAAARTGLGRPRPPQPCRPGARACIRG